MSRILGLLVTVVLFAGFVLLTLLLEGCRRMGRHLTGQPASL